VQCQLVPTPLAECDRYANVLSSQSSPAVPRRSSRQLPPCGFPSFLFSEMFHPTARSKEVFPHVAGNYPLRPARFSTSLPPFSFFVIQLSPPFNQAPAFLVQTSDHRVLRRDVPTHPRFCAHLTAVSSSFPVLDAINVLSKTSVRLALCRSVFPDPVSRWRSTSQSPQHTSQVHLQRFHMLSLPLDAPRPAPPFPR